MGGPLNIGEPFHTDGAFNICGPLSILEELSVEMTMFAKAGFEV